MLNISVYIYCVTCCSCFSQLSLLVLLYFLYFSVFLLLLEYVNLDNSFCYQVLVEVCMFLIIFIFIILSMFVCITYFCRIYRKKKSFDRIPWNDWFLRSFEKFFRTPLLQSTSGKLLISCTSCRISTTRHSKKLFHRCCSSILYKNKSSHLKVFIYLKSQRIICEAVNL